MSRNPPMKPEKLVVLVNLILQNTLSPKEIAFLLDIHHMSVYQTRKKYFLEIWVRNGIPLPLASRSLTGELKSGEVPRYRRKK